LQRIAIQPSQLDDDRVLLTPSQVHYLTRVLRLQSGDRFQAIDGSGNLYLVEIENDRGRKIELITTSDPELPVQTRLICALPKGNGFDDVVRACTELGVSEIYPAISDRTLLQPSPNKCMRWRKIAEEAAEQSERTLLPNIHQPQAFLEILGGFEGDRYICGARGEYPHLWDCLERSVEVGKEITIAIGPEGGWTERELDRAIQAGFEPVSLGKRILRAITAPIAVMSLVAAHCEADKTKD
jgi:16S rRNA (uracil1498-N3)-methyltransferase